MLKQNKRCKKERRIKGKKSVTKKKVHLRRLTAACLAIVALAVIAVGAGLFWTFYKNDRVAQTAQADTVLKESEPEETVPEAETETETESEEPDIYVELTEGNISGYVKVESCAIAEGTGNFVLTGRVDEKPASDDDYFYLFEMKMYETELNTEGDYIASVEKNREFALTAGINENRADSRLNSRFAVAVKLNGEYVPLCDPQYITNPEALAAYKDAFPERDSIKGILVDPLRVDGLDDLNVKHGAYNIPIANILGETTNSMFPTIHYTYNGKTYSFNGQRIAEYDSIFSRLTKKGITITAILLNNKSAAQPQLIHPLSRGGSGHYYAFNTAEEAGVETIAAVGSFLGQRYRNDAFGVVMNWVVGNEVNVRSDWNYMQYVDLDTYAGEYANAVRLFYNSIKSMNANARVYVSMDQQWDRNLSSNNCYDVKDLLASFNKIISAEGNIGWGLAHHPYAYPLTNTTFWNSSAKIQDLITNSEDTSIVTMQNIGVVTGYLQRPEMLTADGEVRPVILSELGYSSSKGEINQAAAFTYAYYAAENNPYIDALILSRQTDAAEEVSQGLALGLSTQGGTHKYIYDVFKNIDSASSESYTEFAKSIIGINSWSEIMASSRR